MLHRMETCRRRLAIVNILYTLQRRLRCLFADTAGSVGELTCPSTTRFALLGSLSKLRGSEEDSPRTMHRTCACVDIGAVEEVVLREAKGLFTRSSPCAASAVESGSNHGVGTICSCVNCIAKRVPCTLPLARC